MIDRLEPDVVLLDIIMPHLDGLAVLEKSRKRKAAKNNHADGLWSGGCDEKGIELGAFISC